jgi:hypothetical protein
MNDPGISGQFPKKGLFCFFQSVRHVPANLFGLPLSRLFRPPFSQFAVLPVHADREKKQDQGRQKNRTPEKKDLLEVPAVGPAEQGGFHPTMVAFHDPDLS